MLHLRGFTTLIESQYDVPEVVGTHPILHSIVTGIENCRLERTATWPRQPKPSWTRRRMSWTLTTACVLHVPIKYCLPVHTKGVRPCNLERLNLSDAKP